MFLSLINLSHQGPYTPAPLVKCKRSRPFFFLMSYVIGFWLNKLVCNEIMAKYCGCFHIQWGKIADTTSKNTCPLFCIPFYFTLFQIPTPLVQYQSLFPDFGFLFLVSTNSTHILPGSFHSYCCRQWLHVFHPPDEQVVQGQTLIAFPFIAFPNLPSQSHTSALSFGSAVLFINCLLERWMWLSLPLRMHWDHRNLGPLLIILFSPRACDRDSYLPLDECLMGVSLSCLSVLVLIYCLDDSLNLLSLYVVQIALCHSSCALLFFPLFFLSLYTFICCHLTSQQSYSPHFKLRSNDNTYSPGQERILLWNCHSFNPSCSLVLLREYLISTEHIISYMHHPLPSHMLFLYTNALFFSGEINILNKHQSIIIKLVLCALPLLSKSFHIQSFWTWRSVVEI